MMAKSPKSLTTRARIAAASIIPGIGPQKKPKNAAHWLFFFSSKALGPYRRRRFLASSEVKPRSELPSCLNRLPMASLCGAEDDGPGSAAAGVCVFIFAGDGCWTTHGCHCWLVQQCAGGQRVSTAGQANSGTRRRRSIVYFRQAEKRPFSARCRSRPGTQCPSYAEGGSLPIAEFRRFSGKSAAIAALPPVQVG